MYVDKIKIENLRCFDHAEIRFVHPDRADLSTPLRNVTVLVGNNGAGKTTTLKAIVLATLGPVLQSAGLVPYSLVRRRVGTAAPWPKARIEGQLVMHDAEGWPPGSAGVDLAESVVEVERISDTEKLSFPPPRAGTAPRQIDQRTLYDSRSPSAFLVGYGATRRIEVASIYDQGSSRKTRMPRYQRAAGLFEEHVTLTPMNAWLPGVRSKQPALYKQIVELLVRLLPPTTKFTGELEEGEYLFEYAGSRLPFGAMSDGYRAYVGWVTDLLSHLAAVCPPKKRLDELVGVVLVDEVDLHLHPRWQREVVDSVSKALPRMQFILTSHSPIVVGAVHRENLCIFERGEDGAAEALPIGSGVYGKTADQVLLSPYFGLASTRAPGAVDEMALLARQAAQGDPSAALKALEHLSGGFEEMEGDWAKDQVESKSGAGRVREERYEVRLSPAQLKMREWTRKLAESQRAGRPLKSAHAKSARKKKDRGDEGVAKA